jgi:hypothetical protein
MATASTALDVIERASLGLPTSYVAPQDDFETSMATAFAKVFNLDHVGADDDFFDLEATP